MGPSSRSKANGGAVAEPQYRLIPLKLLDPPAVAMRVNMDDELLAGLASSIRDTGLIHPICVVAEGARYRICSGHRRYLACKMLGRDEVQCKDYTRTGIPPDQIKAHENLFSEHPNDGELIQWLRDEQAKRERSMDELRAMTGKSEHWINTRMAIVRGDEAVFVALVKGQINLAHATELNKFPDDYRPAYLQNVIETTPPAHLVANWRKDVNLMLSHQQPGANIPAPVPIEAMPGMAPVQACALCEQAHSPWTYQTITVHKGCIESVVKALREGGQ